jgi:hypothetical protein
MPTYISHNLDSTQYYHTTLPFIPWQIDIKTKPIANFSYNVPLAYGYDYVFFMIDE